MRRLASETNGGCYAHRQVREKSLHRKFGAAHIAQAPVSGPRLSCELPCLHGQVGGARSWVKEEGEGVLWRQNEAGGTAQGAAFTCR